MMTRTRIVRLALAAGLVLGATANGPHARADAAPPPTPAEPKEPRDIVLSWKVTQGLWGAEVITLTSTGEARFEFQSFRAKVPKEVATGTLSPAELAAIHATLASNSVCTLKPTREHGIPDEGRPTLMVAFSDLSCSVTLWDGDWEGQSRAKASADVVDGLRKRLRAPQK